MLVSHAATERCSKYIAATLAAFAVALAFALCVPAQAHADYSNPSVKTTAQVQTDGSMHVVEHRTFDFEESYSIITWAFTGISSKSSIEIGSVRISQLSEGGTVDSEWSVLEAVPFQMAWRDFVIDTDGITAKVDRAKKEAEAAEKLDSSKNVGLPKNGTCSFDERRCNLYIFLDPTNTPTIIECDYLITEAALVYEDTAELFWDYVSAKDDVSTRNVDVEIQLPVPDNFAVIPGKTVRAWGHGAPGTVEVSPDGTVDYIVPEVSAGQYAQAHVLFPIGWLTNLPLKIKNKISGFRYDNAVAGEEDWVDSYTAGVLNGLTIDVIVLSLCAVALILALVMYAAFGRERKPEDEGGASAVNLERAVMGRTLRWNKQSCSDFTSTLIQLRDKGIIQIDGVDDAVGEDGKPDFSNVRFRVTPSAKKAKLTSIERATLTLLYDVIGDEYQLVTISEIRRFLTKNPDRFKDAMRKWQDVLTKQVASAGVFDLRSAKLSKIMLVVGIFFVVCAGYAWFAGGNQLVCLAAVLTGFAVVIIAHYTERRTQLGSNLEAAAEPADNPAWADYLDGIMEKALIS